MFAFAAGCSYAMRPVAFAAPHEEWEGLAGDWRGEYTIGGRERHGLIEFRLKALEHQASGDVVMIADRFVWPMAASRRRTASPVSRLPARSY